MAVDEEQDSATVMLGNWHQADDRMSSATARSDKPPAPAFKSASAFAALSRTKATPATPFSKPSKSLKSSKVVLQLEVDLSSTQKPRPRAAGKKSSTVKHQVIEGGAIVLSDDEDIERQAALSSPIKGKARLTSSVSVPQLF